MATPARALILDNLETVLVAIGSNATDKTAPQKVERVIKDWVSVGGNERPWIGFRPAREITTHTPFGRIEVRLTVDIVGHVSSGSDGERSDRLNDLMDDIYAALNRDTTRDGNAVTTTVKQTETDEGSPDTIDSRGGGGSLVMNVEIFYERTTSAS